MVQPADEACEDALYEIPAFLDFCRIDLGHEQVPDAMPLLNFLHLLEGRKIDVALFAKVGELLQFNGMMLSGGTIVDVMLIAVPPSTKNREQAQDPEMRQSMKGNQWKFRMKAHIGAVAIIKILQPGRAEIPSLPNQIYSKFWT